MAHNVIHFQPGLAERTGVVRAPAAPVSRAPRLAPAYEPMPGPAQAWMALAIGSLLFAGLFALLLVVRRIPPFSFWINDADFFRRCLVLHVNLSLLVWFCAGGAMLFSRLPGAPRGGVGMAAVSLSTLGTALMSVSAFAPGAAPVLSNYIPFIDHPLFSLGLILFLSGPALMYLVAGGEVWGLGGGSGQAPSPPSATAWGIRASAAAFLLAVLTMALAWMVTPVTGLTPRGYYELVVWGGGHVLQVAHVCAMMAIWLLLLGKVLNRPILSPRVALLLFGLLILPHGAGIYLTVQGTESLTYYRGFTRLMQFGIFPVVLVVMGFAVAAWKATPATMRPRWFGDYRVTAVGLSMLMTLCGFLLGAMIRGPSTMVPAHYHASIGAVTVAFMGVIYLLAGHRMVGSRPARTARLMNLQLMLFGGGQLVFALGFGFGGLFGLGRKTYESSEQLAYSVLEYAGLAVMGLGGLVAAAGGVLFLILALRIFRRSHSSRDFPLQPTQPSA